MNQGQVYALSGIDTGIGKTIATGLLARALMQTNRAVITQKLVQTGCRGISEDILTHRQIMGTGNFREDVEGLTCPYVFDVPCSPHLAAQLADEIIDCERIRRATATLCSRYDIVLLEGAGGLFVSLSENFTVLDYLEQQGYPLILVSSSRLGSINHSLSSLEALHRRGMNLAGLIYNRGPEGDKRIADDSRRIIELYMRKYWFYCPVVDMYELSSYQENHLVADFAVFFAGNRQPR
jgi:dethiobiotin synthetase